MIDLFGLEQQPKRIHDKPEAAALVVWGNTLVDGHNRYEICTRLGLPFETVLKEFDSRNDATEWIINNQFGRRNLSDYQRGVLALRMKPIIEARALARQQGGQGGILLSEMSHEATPAIRTDEGNAIGGGKSSEKSHETSPMRTDEVVAGLANISSNTIRKIEHIEQAAAPEIKALAAAGDVSINLASQFNLIKQRRCRHEYTKEKAAGTLETGRKW